MKKRRVHFGVTVVLLFTFFALLGPALAPHDPAALNLDNEWALPSANHWLGTGDNGTDLLSALLHGARIAGVVGVSVVAVSLFVGTILGTVAGYLGGRADHLITGFADLVQAFPAVVLNIAILALVAEPGLSHLILALCANGWVLYARVARAQALSLREREFVQAARALGMGQGRIVLRHVVPNLAGPLIVQASGGMGAVILAESTLSFLGLGPGQAASWGALLDQGTAVLLRFPHVAIFSGAAIATTVLGFNLAGDWLRDRFDPR